MSFKSIIVSMPLIFAIGGCNDSKKAEAPAEPAKPAEQQPAHKADPPPPKVGVHITTETHAAPEPEPEPKPNGLFITVEGEADFEVK